MITDVKWRQIADELRARIAQGVLSPGDPVDTEDGLAKRYGVARGTARGALVALEREGLLYPGRPRRVAQRTPLAVHVARSADHAWAGESPTAGADAWVGDMHRAGQPPGQEIDVARVAVGGDAAGALEVPGGITVVSRRLTRVAAGRPHNLITFWFPLEVAEGTLLAEPGSITEGSVAWLEKTHGPLAHEVRVSARMPSPGEAERLRIPSGVPVMVVWRVSRSGAGPVVASMAVYPADRAVLKLDL